MPAFMWKEKSYVGVNHLLSRDHHEDNTADFSVHIALVQVLPLAYFFITFYFKENSRPNLYRRVKFVSRNSILGNLSIEFFSCKISSRSGMWEKCCQGSSQKMHSGGLRSL